MRGRFQRFSFRSRIAISIVAAVASFSALPVFAAGLLVADGGGISWYGWLALGSANGNCCELDECRWMVGQ